MWSLWQMLRERWRRMRSKADMRHYDVTADGDGLRVACDSVAEFRGRLETWRVAWTEVQRVIAYKSDNLTYDTIWVSIGARDGGEVAFPDTADGWQQILEALPGHLPGCTSFAAWFPTVAFPAFAPNPTVLFDRVAPA